MGALALGACGDAGVVSEAAAPAATPEPVDTTTDPPDPTPMTQPDDDDPRGERATVEPVETADPPEPAETETAVEVEQDPQLVADLEPLLVGDVPEVNLILDEELPDTCPSEAGGCYLSGQPATIVVKEEVEGAVYTELIAHEYLHHVWRRDNLEADTALEDALNAAYENEERLGASIPSWIPGYELPDGSIVTEELFAYACTGLRSDQMDNTISDRCEEYLNVDQLPVYDTIASEDVVSALNELRDSEGLDPLPVDPNAEAASAARADLFSPHEHTPLDEWPDSVTRHLYGLCEPSNYVPWVGKPGDVEVMAPEMDTALNGAVTSSRSWGVGVSVTDFDYLDVSDSWGEDRMVQVNVTLIVVTVCG